MRNKSGYEKKGRDLLKKIKRIENSLIKKHGITNNEAACNDPQYGKYSDLLSEYYKLKENPQRFEDLYLEILPDEFWEQWEFHKGKEKYLHDINLNEVLEKAKKKTGKANIEIELPFEEFKTLLDALLIARKYQNTISDNKRILEIWTPDFVLGKKIREKNIKIAKDRKGKLGPLGTCILGLKNIAGIKRSDQVIKTFEDDSKNKSVYMDDLRSHRTYQIDFRIQEVSHEKKKVFYTTSNSESSWTFKTIQNVISELK